MSTLTKSYLTHPMARLGTRTVAVGALALMALLRCSTAADTKKVPLARLERGLSPQAAAQFSDDYSTFTCDGGATVLSADAVNDGYCDCADSTDEYGTPACPQGTFYCRNKHYVPSTIPSGYLDDGVCDCADGSDEPPSKCPNLCDKYAEERREEARKRLAGVEAALNTRKELEQRGVETLEAKKKELAETTALLETKKQEQDKAHADYDQKNAAFTEKDKELRAIEEECLFLLRVQSFIVASTALTVMVLLCRISREKEARRGEKGRRRRSKEAE